MKRILILLLITITCALETNGQNYVVVGDNSYPRTETFTLQSDSDVNFISDLNLTFAKDGAKAVLVVSSKLVSTVRISGKLTIELVEGTVITCNETGLKENIYSVASTTYSIPNDELMKLKISNINKVNYAIKCADCSRNLLYQGNYSASNKGKAKTDFTAIIKEFYEE
ncbi:MAG: hypothetical protein ACJAV5_000108 [Vicingaceae bacterium]|jgi:hypothetical protein